MAFSFSFFAPHLGHEESGDTLDVFRQVERSLDVPAEIGPAAVLIKERGCQRQRSLRKDKSVHALLHFLPKVEGGEVAGRTLEGQ